MAQEWAKSFYNSKAWQDTQAAYMVKAHYVCERCGRFARVVHHREYLTPENIGDPCVSLSFDSLEALCMECHNEEHMSGGMCAKGLYFNADGDLISAK